MTGSGMGTLAVTTRQVHSRLVPKSFLKESQQLEEGDDPFALLPVMKLKHGVKVEIMDALQGVLIWASTDMNGVITQSAEANTSASSRKALVSARACPRTSLSPSLGPRLAAPPASSPGSCPACSDSSFWDVECS